jgi:hypothetical protein
MAEEAKQVAGVTKTLTPEEQEVLSKVLEKVEDEIFRKVVKRLSAWVGTVLILFTVGGLVSMNSCYSNVETSSVQKLSADPELRNKIIIKVQENMKEVQEKLKGVNERAEEIERENARASVLFTNDLENIHFMLKRINDDLSGHFPSSNQNRSPEGENGK